MDERISSFHIKKQMSLAFPRILENILTNYHTLVFEEKNPKLPLSRVT